MSVDNVKQAINLKITIKVGGTGNIKVAYIPPKIKVRNLAEYQEMLAK